MLFSTPLKNNSTKIMLLGSGELGKEVAIEAQRLGVEVIAVDRYENAPAHLVANRSHVVNMQDKEAVIELIRLEKPDYILPEIEAISIDALFMAEDAMKSLKICIENRFGENYYRRMDYKTKSLSKSNQIVSFNTMPFFYCIY